MLRELVMVSFACCGVLAQGVTQPQKPVVWGKISGSFQLAIVSDKGEYKVGEAIRVTANLKNVADHPVLHQASRAFYSIDVRIPIADWIPWKPQARLTPEGETAMRPLYDSVIGLMLPPGRENASEFQLDKLYDMSAPGRYRITFSCREPSDASTGPAVTVVSNEISVTVLPK